MAFSKQGTHKEKHHALWLIQIPPESSNSHHNRPRGKTEKFWSQSSISYSVTTVGAPNCNPFMLLHGPVAEPATVDRICSHKVGAEYGIACKILSINTDLHNWEKSRQLLPTATIQMQEGENLHKECLLYVYLQNSALAFASHLPNMGCIQRMRHDRMHVDMRQHVPWG